MQMRTTVHHTRLSMPQGTHKYPNTNKYTNKTLQVIHGQSPTQCRTLPKKLQVFGKILRNLYKNGDPL